MILENYVSEVINCHNNKNIQGVAKLIVIKSTQNLGLKVHKYTFS